MTNLPPTPAQWDAATDEYDAFLGTPIGRLRAELAWRYARAALPTPQIDETPPLVVDAGCGPGRTTVRLLEAGYRVYALDPAAAMLAEAQARLDRLDPKIAARATLTHAGLADLPTLLGATRCDAIICHNVLEFVADPAAAIGILANLLRPDGVLSILTLNRWSEIFRVAAATRDPAAILAALDRRALPETMTGGARQLNDPDEIRGWLAAAGLDLVTQHGIRLLTDHLPNASYDELLAVELALAAQAPPAFAYLGRQIQFIARKPNASPPP